MDEASCLQTRHEQHGDVGASRGTAGTRCTPSGCNLQPATTCAQQQQEGAAAGSSAWAGAIAAKRRCLLMFDVHLACYVAAYSLGQQVCWVVVAVATEWRRWTQPGNPRRLPAAPCRLC